MNGSDSFELLFNEISRQITNLNDTLALIGLYYLTKTSLKCLLNIYRGVKVYIVSQVFGNDKWLRSMGEWAIVTGASQGIGLAYAKELAKRKFNLILIARQGDKLEKVKQSLESRFCIKVVPIVADLTDERSFKLIENHINLHDIGVLVNNAGMLNEPCRFHLIPNEIIDGLIDLNSRALVHMTKLVLSQMIKKNKGCIVNIASGIPFLTGNYFSVYAGSKVFVDKFTEALEFEYRKTKIVFQCVNPVGVKTPTTVLITGKWGKMTPIDANRFAGSAIKTIGYTNYTCGYWLHGILVTTTNMMPKILHNFIFVNLFEKFFDRENRKRQINVDTNSHLYDDIDFILNK